MAPAATSSPTWNVEETPWEPARNLVWESRFTAANGYLGIRGYPEEPFDAGPTCPEVYVSGVFNTADEHADITGGIPELAVVTDFLAADVLLEGKPMRMAPDRVREYSRRLDLRRGLLTRSFVYTEDGRSTRLVFERFADMANPHLAGQSVEVTPLDWSGDVAVRLWLDWAGDERRRNHLRFLHARHMGRDRLLAVTQTSESRIRIGHACRASAWIQQTAPIKPRHLKAEGRLGFGYETHLECNQRSVFDRIVSTYTSRDPETTSVERCCLEDVRALTGGTYGVHRRRHVRTWRRGWKRFDLAIDGPKDDQRALRFAIFHLVQACPQRDASVSIAAKGLTGPGYRGHVFWDTEVFMVPFFVATRPRAARRLLHYRVLTLDGAGRKAAAAGYNGAMFAWESTDTGDETCPPYVPDPKTGEPVRVLTGELQHHIVADIPLAAWRYVMATGDTAFRERQLLMLAVETARFWASRVVWNADPGRYEVPDVIGPDEYHERVDNNVFTNFMAAWNLRLAADEVARMRAVHPRSHLLRWLGVGDEELRRWRAVAESLYLPPPGPDGLLEQYDGFFRLDDLSPEQIHALSAQISDEPENRRMARIHRAQILKQADVVMLMALFPEAYDREARRRNYDYYEPRTTHDSSLSPSVHAIAAADLDRRDEAYDYFRRSAFIDLEDTMGNADAGLHLAAMGGTWQAAVRGFVGLRLDGETPEVRPRLPRAWHGVTMRFRHRRQRYLLEIDGPHARLTPES